MTTQRRIARLEHHLDINDVGLSGEELARRYESKSEHQRIRWAMDLSEQDREQLRECLCANQDEPALIAADRNAEITVEQLDELSDADLWLVSIGEFSPLRKLGFKMILNPAIQTE